MRIPIWKRTLPALALLLFTAVALPARADHGHRARGHGHSHAFAPDNIAAQRISIQEAIAKVQRQTGGRVLDARDQGDRYRIKVLTRDGEVRIVYVDATTGETR